jgi:hypothetical protein
MNPTLSVSSTGDLSFMREAVKGLAEGKVYVGVPEKETNRPPTKYAPVTNAGLMYIHTNGSVKWNFPPRPVIEPSIEAHQEKIQQYLNSAASLALDGKTVAANSQLRLCGQYAANRAKEWFFDRRNGWAQDAPSTIARKIAKLQKFRKNKKGVRVSAGPAANREFIAAQAVLQSVNKFRPKYGLTPLDTINTPLIDTGELRRSITYVIEEIQPIKTPQQPPITTVGVPIPPATSGGMFGGVNVVPKVP